MIVKFDMKRLNIFRLINILLLITICVSEVSASQSIRTTAQSRALIDEDQIIRDLEREIDEDKNRKNINKADKTSTKNTKDIENIKDIKKQSSSSQKIDLTFLILTLVGLALIELAIIFTDYIKPKFFDDLY
jgi:patatin-like phospholipase/acyl hydrolase